MNSRMEEFAGAAFPAIIKEQQDGSERNQGEIPLSI